jgi:tetratricopeptide (TPR) repeat protein
MLRPLLGVLRVTFVHFALGALGCWSLWAQFVYRVPDRFLSIALAAATAAGVGLSLVSWIAEVFEALNAAPEHHKLVERTYRVCALTVLAFSFYSLYVFTNGKFDLSDPVPHPTTLVSIAHDEGLLGPSTPFTWMTVRSWRDPARIDRLLVRWDERQRLWPGQPVVVLERRGYWAKPWVSAVEPDLEAQSREILRLAPDALTVWKNLAWFHVRLLRFDDARRAAGEYIARAPQDPEFPVQIASAMMGRDRFVEIAAVLEPVVRRHERADIYASYGYAVAMQGKREGIKYLERAAAMEPKNWWPHYGLGHAYGIHGEYRRAVASFERALQLRPGLADVIRLLPDLRQRAAQMKRA